MNYNYQFIANVHLSDKATLIETTDANGIDTVNGDVKHGTGCKQ